MATKHPTIEGNTFPVKDELKALGARWDAVDRVWRIAPDKLEEAKALVAKGPQAGFSPKPFRRTTCASCGHRATGRYGDVIYRSGECRDCYEERKMGY